MCIRDSRYRDAAGDREQDGVELLAVGRLVCAYADARPRAQDVGPMTRGTHEGGLDAGRDGVVGIGAVADVLAGGVEAVAVGLHVAENLVVGGRDLVAEVFVVAHVLSPPLGLLVEVRVLDQGVEPGPRTVLIGQGAVSYTHLRAHETV